MFKVRFNSIRLTGGHGMSGASVASREQQYGLHCQDLLRRTVFVGLVYLHTFDWQVCNVRRESVGSRVQYWGEQGLKCHNLSRIAMIESQFYWRAWDVKCGAWAVKRSSDNQGRGAL